MKRLLLPLSVGALSLGAALTLGAAEDEAPPPSRTELYALLVDESLEVADETDPLERAASSARVADQLSDAIVRAATAGDKARVQELALLLAKVLNRGIDHNVAGIDAAALPADRRDELNSLKVHPQLLCQLLDKKLGMPSKPAIEPLKQVVSDAYKKSMKPGPKGEGKDDWKEPNWKEPRWDEFFKEGKKEEWKFWKKDDWRFGKKGDKGKGKGGKGSKPVDFEDNPKKGGKGDKGHKERNRPTSWHAPRRDQAEGVLVALAARPTPGGAPAAVAWLSSAGCRRRRPRGVPPKT
jgi:hypothetical protein